MFRTLSREESVRFINSLQRVLHVRNDQAMAQVLGVLPSSVSQIRKKVQPVTSSMILQVLWDHPELTLRYLNTLWNPPQVQVLL